MLYVFYTLLVVSLLVYVGINGYILYICNMLTNKTDNTNKTFKEATDDLLKLLSELYNNLITLLFNFEKLEIDDAEKDGIEKLHKYSVIASRVFFILSVINLIII